MKKIVYKNDGTIPVDDILCTTYQMRNFYHQFRDGFFSPLDVMNYIQHLAAVRMMRKNDIILDVCCGRGLLLPLMRYHAKNIKKYIGVDIESKNIKAKRENICNGKLINPEDYYPFETEWIISNVSEMSDKIKDKVDFIIYTSSIEHMQKNDGEKSLEECSKVIRPGGRMFLSCPNTPENRNGFDVQYKAHVYEWKLSELRECLDKNDFTIEKEIGLVGNVRDFTSALSDVPEIKEILAPTLEYLPREFLTPILFISLPTLAKEVLLICKRNDNE